MGKQSFHEEQNYVLYDMYCFYYFYLKSIVEMIFHFFILDQSETK